MTPTPEEVAPHMARCLDMLDAAFRRYGVSDGLPERFRDAVAATPRHLFVHRFRLRDGPTRGPSNDNSVRDNDADPVGQLADIYSDAVMIHVDAAGERLRSTNSQPTYMLWPLGSARPAPWAACAGNRLRIRLARGSNGAIGRQGWPCDRDGDHPRAGCAKRGRPCEARHRQRVRARR
jgi:hypothetical protein